MTVALYALTAWWISGGRMLRQWNYDERDCGGGRISGIATTLWPLVAATWSAKHGGTVVDLPVVRHQQILLEMVANV